MAQIIFVLAAVIVAIAHVARALTPGFHYCHQQIAAEYTEYEIWQIVYNAHLEPLATANLLFTYNADHSVSVNKTCSRGCYGGIPGGAICIPDWVPEGQYVDSDIADRLAQGRRR
ncbi:hypothetical protein E4U17_006600 [Claviceps sp. LM77 group G4]|nr:hypothetical protein E4U17_006600 [Claviceps sp. LM77 group G4]KAG6077534.1 hypothetical protein E4U16_002181 [Claviceps sp. LM84 group G4]KAG6080731.1 hypothetical protein E4U33_007353 [Claviceps sp. LM78 group G4]